MKILPTRKTTSQLENLDVFNTDKAYSFLYWQATAHGSLSLGAAIPTLVESVPPSFDDLFTNEHHLNPLPSGVDAALPFIVTSMRSGIANSTRRAVANVLFASQEMHDRWEAACVKAGLISALTFDKIVITDLVPKNEIRVGYHSFKPPMPGRGGYVDGALQVTPNGIFMNYRFPNSMANMVNNYFVKVVLP